MIAASPACPAGWDCTFTENGAPFAGPWWEGPWGIVVGILVVLALAVAFSVAAYNWYQYRQHKADLQARDRQRQHELAVEEQRTLQADAAKGDPELFRLIREGR